MERKRPRGSGVAQLTISDTPEAIVYAGNYLKVDGAWDACVLFRWQWSKWNQAKF